ncbi:MAG TPA: thioredoxin domain-containing protein [Terriglobia bacterium]|nr:thioredoxin domain-containing protein [Terriglobia bacterium]
MDQKSEIENPKSNDLARAKSAYLRTAAHQPVHWLEWGDEAFARAQREDKPILLDIGAVWCHWCHVMDRESYENHAVAEVINQHYVPVKVDRDERPDIDARYQMAVSALTGQGGWPLTTFLTPEGKPFYGGTYFPPDDAMGRPGFKRVLQSIAHNYQTHRTEIWSSADQIAQAMSSFEKFGKEGQQGQKGKTADEAVVDSIIHSAGRMFDRQHGGFGSAPKFFHPGALELMLDAYLESRQEWLRSAVTVTLEHMGRGGVYDQIGGGFHRYSVDERWIVPHFEKMSYDNAALLVDYLRAYQITGEDFFREIALGTVAFIRTVLSSSEGGFYASQDADYSLEDDGDYFTWTLEELRAALNEREAEVAAQYYHVEERGEMHHNPAKNVLFIDQPIEAIAARLTLEPQEVEETLAAAKIKLRAARAQRPTPYVDTTLYASWNGMMISAFLEAYKVLGPVWDDDSVRATALQALERMLAVAYDPAKGMYHSVVDGNAQIEGLLDDQVFMITALLDAYEVTGRRAYYDRALELMETTVRRFWDAEAGGFFDTAKDLSDRQGVLNVTRKSFQDSPTPAGNSVAVLALDRLASLADRADFREKAKVTLDLFAAKAPDYGIFAAAYGLALVNHLRAPLDVVVIGTAEEARTRELLTAAYHAPLAGKRVFSFEPAQVNADDLPKGFAATLPHLPLDGEPVALVCSGASCQPPVHTGTALAEMLTPAA